jgi:hypothetical protein
MNSDRKALNAYLDALAERDGAVAALQFMPGEHRTECETRIRQLNLTLALKAAALGPEQMELYKDSIEARRHNVADLIAHLERMRPYATCETVKPLSNSFSPSVFDPGRGSKKKQ